MSIAAAAAATAAIPLVGDLVKAALPVAGEVVKAASALLQPFADGAAKKIFGEDTSDANQSGTINFATTVDKKITFDLPKSA
ncbi:hypothetical protein HX792_00245 [Pseudomonas sp. B6002]|uniref:hypothetical protein n=1 Tax=Pseudomonas sp. B6002 TaxID=2726978 RepID=UPI0015A334D6|nr:hypothetical protein [Pseudomonas sp. B6002]NVZ48739.1 hypothetical protein [Pseudomonas sp. B6002]